MATARTRRLRWSAPVLVAAVIGMIVAVPGLSAADSPTLPRLTPAQLISKAQQAKISAFSGTVNLSTNLGIPNLSALAGAAGGGGHGQSFSPTDLLSGAHQARVWFASPDSARVALFLDMAEVDVVHHGQDIWTWDSTSKKVVHYTVAAETGPAGTSAKAAAPDPTEAVKTPQQVADDLLAHIDPTTKATVGASVRVAGQAAYQLVLTPRAGVSTVDHVVITIDSVTGMPLEVQTFAKGQKAAAVDLGFSHIDYSKPAASRFTFTPPPGSTLTTKALGGSHTSAPTADTKPAAASATDTSQPTMVGQDWATVALFHNVQIPKQVADFLKAASPVSGSFGSGRLIQTSLVNVLVLDDGRVAVGAVTVGALEAAVASAH
jgi:outer membrane lipoprotein-sorting protein